MIELDTSAPSDRLPDLDDMMLAGLTLTQSLRLWNEMMSRRHIPTADWWEFLRSFRQPTLQ
jgi:hypothetical protein